MIGVFVKFHYGEEFDEGSVSGIAARASAMFEGMPGLRSKAFTVNSQDREATNFYIWDDEEAATAFFTHEMIGRIANVYGVSPAIEFVKVAALVENSPA